MTYKIHTGDNRDILKTIPDNSIDAIVTDPPYGIDFLGKSWDANTGALETYEECLRVLKPGGHILAFSAARTYHHLAITLEQAGFEIRDQIMWIYSSGFPKSQDIGKSIQRGLGVKEKAKLKSNGPANGMSRMTFNQSDPAKFEETKNAETTVCTDPEAIKWAGWGTALKPAHEPIALARKPLKQSIAKNCQEWGTGAINIDATRIPTEDVMIGAVGNAKTYENFSAENTDKDMTPEGVEIWQGSELGRFPSNVLGEILQADYQKYFYCPKVSREERHMGFDTKNLPVHPEGMFEHGGGDLHKRRDTEGVLKNWEMVKAMGGHYITADGKPILEDGDFGNQAEIPGYGWINLNGIKSIYGDWCKKHNVVANHGNNHPTVKPIELMKYLIKLITPPGGVVLDPFNGSGTTGMAAVELGFDYIGCELDPAYVEISLKRIEAWRNRDYLADVFDDLFTFGD
jgi:site-specific DNA-methyltransferase (adenine-specific)